jgi:DNA repair/transcription protein MET18/MMS19
LKALEATASNYGPKTVALYSVTLWDAIKFEVLQVQEEELAQESLQVLIAIGKTLANGPKQGLVDYLKPVVKECNEHLEDAPTKQSDAACRILTAVASSSSYACNIIIPGVFPHLFILAQAADNIPKRRGLAQVLRNLLQINSEIFGDWQHVPLNLSVADGQQPQDIHLPENVLQQYSKQILGFLKDSLQTTSIKEVSYRLVLLESLVQLAKIREILNDDDISQVVKVFNNVIISEESYTKDEAKVTAMTALLEIAHQKPQIIIDLTFPSLLSHLPEADTGSSDNFVPILEAFARISVEERVFATSLIRLKSRLTSAVHHKSSARYIQAILSAILYSFQHVNPLLLGGVENPSPYHDLVLPLLTQICPTLKAEDDLTFALIGRIANTVIRIQPSSFQAEFAPSIYTISTGLDLQNSPPFAATRSADTTRHLLISLYLLGALRRDVPLPFDIPDLLNAMVTIVTALEPSVSIKAAALLQVTLIVNKYIPTKDLNNILTPFIQSNLEPATGSLGLDGIRVGFAILKGLVLRNAPLLKDMFPILLKALSDQSAGYFVAQGFSTLLQPEEVLTKENHCLISPLHRQKTFALAVPAIIDGYRSVSSDVKKNYLVALSGILQWLPYSAFEAEVSSITPLLLQTLDISGEYEIKLGTIDKIIAILQENPRVVEEHVASVITRLLNLSNPKLQQNPPAVRAKSLQCLSMLAFKLRLEIVLPFQKQVVKKLIDSLDDNRRAVRAEAVKCRTKWVNLDDDTAKDEEDS